MNMYFTVEKIEKQLIDIRAAIHRQSSAIPEFKFFQGECPGAERPEFDDRDWSGFPVGESWGGYDVVAWFRAWLPIPPDFKDKKLALWFQVGTRDGGGSAAESMLYVDGAPLQAIDRWHEEAWLPPEFARQDEILVALKAWSGVQEVPDRRRFNMAQIIWIDEVAERFYSQADTLLKSLRLLGENDLRRTRLLGLLDRSFRCIDFIKPGSKAFYESLAAANQLLSEGLNALDSAELKPRVTAIGQAHIDMAWLWRLCHTREKAARTFATALHLMRQYPEYRFLHSSPQLYKYLKDDYPEIFARVKEQIAAGNWEITGGMWIEADTNLPGGESLVRQFLFGRQFIREEFGLETYTLWLPDVFGYSGSLPQIASKCGMKYFMTTKISWNQFNRFPYDTFHWRGIDGTELLTHFVTTPDASAWFYTYNGRLEPAEVKGIWDQYRQKEANDELLLLYGWGDGGGGPTQEMLESARVMKNLPGLPEVRLGKAEDYFQRLAHRLEGVELPVWDGELYLEYHRGTYTSQAYNKRANRQAEILYHDVEWLSALAALSMEGFKYPVEELRQGWELILLNQFHDILPGSSIREVYEDSREQYAATNRIGEGAMQNASHRLIAGIASDRESLVVFNSLSWERSELIELPWSSELDGRTILNPGENPSPVQVVGREGDRKILVEAAGVPSLGYRSYPLVPAATAGGSRESSLKISQDMLENGYYRIRLNKRGQLVSIFDKENRREVLPPGARANAFQAFEDKPIAFDAWDIDIYYQEKAREVDDLVEYRVEEAGPLRAALLLRWRFYDSEIIQRLTLYRNSRRIDFRTQVDWHEKQVLLKVAFPVAVRSTRATYDIQFGSIERPTHWNTSWDLARFETVGHKWVDLSEGNYGVALLNDCKYGHDIKNNLMRLTLIKSAIQPDEQADQGWHEFTYSLLPHAGDWRQGGVVQESYALNYPMLNGLLPGGQAGPLPPQVRFVEVGADNVIVETVKKAEREEAWVVRVYEYKQSRSNEVTLNFGQAIRKAVECNLVEEEDKPVSYERYRLQFPILPYEIKTFKVWF